MLKYSTWVNVFTLGKHDMLPLMFKAHTTRFCQNKQRNAYPLWHSHSRVFKGAPPPVKTEHLTSQAPCSYVTSLYISLFLILPQSFSPITTISSSLGLLSPLLVFGRQNRGRTGYSQIHPLLSPNYSVLCVCFIFPCQIFVGWRQRKVRRPSVVWLASITIQFFTSGMPRQV